MIDADRAAEADEHAQIAADRTLSVVAR